MRDEAEYQRQYYTKNRDRIKKRVQDRHEALKRDPDYRAKRSEYQSKYYLKAGRDRKRIIRYQTTPEEIRTLLEKQGGGCAICGTKDPGGRGAFHIDHDHATGKVRGLLCNNHNLMLGHAHDRVDVLKKAIAYLEKSQC